MKELTRAEKQKILMNSVVGDEYYSINPEKALCYYSNIKHGSYSFRYVDDHVESQGGYPCLQYLSLADLRKELERKTVWDAVNYFHADLELCIDSYVIYKDKRFSVVDFGDWMEFKVCELEEFNQCVCDLSINGKPELFEMYQKSDKTLLEPEKFTQALAEEKAKNRLSAAIELVNKASAESLDPENFENITKAMVQLAKTRNVDVDIDYVAPEGDAVEWVGGDECVYQQCFGDTVLIFGCDATDLKFNNDCVLIHDGNAVPATKSGLSKPETQEQKAEREREERIESVKYLIKGMDDDEISELIVDLNVSIPEIGEYEDSDSHKQVR